MKIVLSTFIPIIMVLGSNNAALPNDSLQTVSRVFYVMGTNLEFNLICKDREYCLDAINDSIAEVKRIDKIFSNYRADSELSGLSIQADSKVGVSQEFFDLTAFSVFISALSRGAFDISIAPLIDVWKKESKNNKTPEANLIKSIRDICTGFDKLKLHSKDYEIGFSSDCIKLDYGAVGKGYVLQRIAQLLVNKKIENGLINFGGNIHALGTDLQGKPWVIKIKDPDNSSEYIRTISVSNMSVSTSGGYERYFLVNSKKYSHIIDPRTGFPVSHFSSVTVVSESPLFADVLSTAFSVLSLDESKEIINQLDKISVLFIETKANEARIYENNNFKNIASD
ncbi:MAG: hypothetical protein GWN11_03445 [Candidatus Dadabacteria bacterium]|nr:hypothetical protein [Candidatus Dadabacteria bacterium]